MTGIRRDGDLEALVGKLEVTNTDGDMPDIVVAVGEVGVICE